MLADNLPHWRLQRCPVDPAMPGDVGDDILVTCDCIGDGRYEVLAGIRSAYLHLPGQPCTAIKCGTRNRWHRSVGSADAGAVRIGGEGVFRDNAVRRRLSAARGSAVHWRWRLHIPLVGMLEGAFEVTVLQAAGEAEREWNFELGSLGPLSFRAR